MHDICVFYENGKTTESKDLQIELLPLMRALFADVNPVPVKQALNLLGLSVGPCRSPLFKIEPAAKEKLYPNQGICPRLSFLLAPNQYPCAKKNQYQKYGSLQ